MKSRLARTAIMGVGAAAALALAHPAAAGDTQRINGCAAHWRTTATWGECINAPGVNVRLQVDCNNQLDWNGSWRYIKGTVDPFDRYECNFKVNGSSLGFR